MSQIKKTYIFFCVSACTRFHHGIFCRALWAHRGTSFRDHLALRTMNFLVHLHLVVLIYFVAGQHAPFDDMIPPQGLTPWYLLQRLRRKDYAAHALYFMPKFSELRFPALSQELMACKPYTRHFLVIYQMDLEIMLMTWTVGG